MIRNVKMMLLLMVALFACGVVGPPAAGAHSVISGFTNLEGGNTVVKMKPDGTGSTAHWEFDLPDFKTFGLTCKRVEFEGTVGGTQPGELVLNKGPGFTECNIAGQPVVVEQKECSLRYHPWGSFLACPKGLSAYLPILACTYVIGPGMVPLATKYENVGGIGSTMEITAEGTAEKIHVTQSGAGCYIPGTHTTGRLTTSNTLIYGEADPSGSQKPLTVDF